MKKPLLLIAALLLFGCQQKVIKKSNPFSSFDGTNIAYTDEGQGSAVVLLHGFINDGSAWHRAELHQQLLDNGYRVVVPDLRGNGKSDQPQNPEAYANNAEAKDLSALLDHLEISSCLAVGYSRGSIVLAKWLTMEKRITKAVLGGMGLDFTNPDWPRRIQFADAFSGRAPLTEETKGAVNYAQSIGADLKILGYLQDHQPVTSIDELANIECPILVIVGDEDLDNGDPAALKAAFAKGELIIVPGDHNNTYKSEDFATSVLSFLLASN